MTTPSGIAHISGIHDAKMPSDTSVDVDQLSPGTVIDIATKTRTYHMECLGGKSVRVSGHPEYCPTPTPAQVQGSLTREGGLELGRIQQGARLMFFLNGNRPVTTSKIEGIHVTRPQADQPSTIH